MSPQQSAHFWGKPKLIEICKRESKCQWIGTHDGDVSSGFLAYNRAVSVGALRPDSCIFHGANWQWSTSGPWGMIRAYSLPYLGCVPPVILDIPIVGAWVAAQRLHAANKPNAPLRLRSWAGV